MTFFLETARLYRISLLRRDKSLLPYERGVYGLFFDAPPGVAPINGCFERDGLYLLYVGTAGADLSKNGHLRNRLGDHHLGGNERRSTVCQTLASLMPDVAGPCIRKLERGNLKFHTSPQGASNIQKWMDEHVSACWATHPDPGALEKELIARYQLPLNLEHNSNHPFAPVLGELRSERHASASRAVG